MLRKCVFSAKITIPETERSDHMDIAGLSTSLSLVNTQNQFGIAMLSKSLDNIETQGESMVSMMDRSMELSVNPNIGSNFDMSV